jgi:hypothetical protein
MARPDTIKNESSFAALATAKAKEASAAIHKAAKQKGLIRVTNATMPHGKGEHYEGLELSRPADRPGADDFLQIPSRFNDQLRFRSGRVEAV